MRKSENFSEIFGKLCFYRRVKLGKLCIRCRRDTNSSVAAPVTMHRHLKAASEFINRSRNREELHDYLSEGFIWEFFLANSPLRESFYERLHRDLKNILYQNYVEAI